MNSIANICDYLDVKFENKLNTSSDLQYRWRLIHGLCPLCSTTLKLMPPPENVARFVQWQKEKKAGSRYHRLYCKAKCLAVIYAWDWNHAAYKDRPFCIVSFEGEDK